MLIEAPYKNGDVITIKLKSGEELVGKLEEENEQYIKVKTPLTLVATQKGIGLQPFLFTAKMDTSYRIKHDAITLITITKKDFADTYLQQMSGLVTAPAGLADMLK